MTSRIAQCQSNLVSSRYRPRGKNFKATYGDPRSLEADLPLYHGAIGDRGVGKSKGISCIDTQVIDIQGNGGWGGIRTHDALAGMPVFKTGALNRSATHPIF